VDYAAVVTVSVVDVCDTNTGDLELRADGAGWVQTAHNGSGGGQAATCISGDTKWLEYHCTMCDPPVGDDSCAVDCANVLGAGNCLPNMATNPYCDGLSPPRGTDSCGINEEYIYTWQCT